MELMHAIFARRAVRTYFATRVPADLIMNLLNAAVQAPSARNLQPWAFAVVRGRSQLDAFSERAKAYMLATLPQNLSLHQRTDTLNCQDYHAFYHADTLIVICANPGPYHPAEDCCLAAENLMLAALALGLGTCPVGFARPWFDLPEVKTEIGIPPQCSVVMPVVVGWPAGPTPAPPRREPEIVAWLETPEEHTEFASSDKLEFLSPSPPTI